MNQFLSIDDVDDPMALLTEAMNIKSSPYADQQIGMHKTLGLLFFNPSLRTRLSTQLAAKNLGMEVMVMNIGEDGWQLEFGEGVIMDGRNAEHIKEAAQVISQYCDIVGIRSFAKMKSYQEDKAEYMLSGLLKYASIPLISLESCMLHPLQSLADWLTIEENKRTDKPKVVLTWAPHPRALPPAVANSFAQWMNHADVNLVIANPPGLDLDKHYTGIATVTNNQEEAFEQADFIYAKNWSVGKSYGRTILNEDDWMITKQKMTLTNNARFMHCLPVRRNVVVSDEVLDGGSSLVIDQANNRTFATQAVLKALLR